jgi:RNA polymerase sigma factor (sigma-70 family)
MTAAEREARILSLEPQVRGLAIQKARRIPSLGLDEIVSAAWLGAIRAVDTFDPAAGNQLKTFAEWCIRSTIADYLRSLDPLSRQHRQQVNRETAAEPRTFSLDPLAAGHLDESVGPIGSVADPRAARDIALVEAALTLQKIVGRARLLPRNESVLRRWLGGERLKVIGASIGVNESRASQICKHTIEQLRAAA